jgi:hypothetical protein
MTREELLRQIRALGEAAQASGHTDASMVLLALYGMMRVNEEHSLAEISAEVCKAYLEWMTGPDNN